jgi:hypothetical protein
MEPVKNSAIPQGLEGEGSLGVGVHGTAPTRRAGICSVGGCICPLCEPGVSWTADIFPCRVDQMETARAVAR